MITRNLTLKKRFYIYFFLLIVLPILLLMGLIFERYYSALFDARLRESENLIRSYGESIEEEIKTMSLKTSALAFNRDFIDLVEAHSRAGSQSEAFQRSKAINNMLNIYFDYSDDIISLCLFLEDGSSYIYKTPPPMTPGQLRKHDWFNRINEQKGRVVLLDDLTYQRVSGQPYYRFGAAIRPDSLDKSSLEAIFVLYQSRALNSINNNTPDSGLFSVADKKGSIMFSAGTADPEGSHILRSHHIGNTSWTLDNYMDLSEIKRPVLDSFLIFVLFMLIITALFALFVMSQFRLIIGPINLSIDRMAMVEKGDFSVRLNASPIPELNRMTESFNSMVREIENLTGQIRRTEREKRKVEIRALQYQINPHFLSNTLNSIKIMARMIQADKIRETTTNLMRILSDTFRNPGRLNTLDHEMKILSDYIQIMKVRFGDSFDVRFRIDGETKSLKIMKLLIQPIVENAVVHGLQEKMEGGCLHIGASVRDKALIISVVDNGAGMETLPEHTAGEDSHSGMYNIGLQNVTDRIRLNYGEEYGLTVKGKKSCYTRVEMKLPLIGEEDD